MVDILVVDSNPAALNAQIQAAGSLPLGQGYRKAVLTCDAGADVAICAPYDGQALPQLSRFDGVIFSGSNVEWVASDPRAAVLAQALRDVFAAGLPVFGSCNGMQLAAHVLGGACGPSLNGREDGLAEAITVAAPAHPMMAGRTTPFRATCVHRDEVTRLPTGATRLAGNAHTAVQAFAYEANGQRFWGTQYHPEYTLGDVCAVLSAGAGWDADQCAALGHFAADPDLADGARLTELRNWLTSL